jgi:multiple antibiotic resistance protein
LPGRGIHALLPQAAVRRHQAMGGLRMVGIIDILIILLVTIGPTKAAAMYLGLTAGAEPALKRQIAIRAVMISAIVTGTFVVLGEALLAMLHVSIPALLIAGGIILFVFALHLVLGEEKEEAPEVGPRTPSLDVAAYPLAVPLMASPQGLVAIVTIAAGQQGFGNTLLLLVLVLVVMGINLAFLLSAEKIFAKVPVAVLKVVMRIFGLLLCGLAVQLVILGLQRLGVLAAAGVH